MKYFLLNTNIKIAAAGHQIMLWHKLMLETKRVIAFCDPWKDKIKRLETGDHVFLYQNTKGICAYGIIAGDLITEAHYGCEKKPGLRYSKPLSDFVLIDPAITATQVRRLTDNITFNFRGTLNKIKAQQAERLIQTIRRMVNQSLLRF